MTMTVPEILDRLCVTQEYDTAVQLFIFAAGLYATSSASNSTYILMLG